MGLNEANKVAIQPVASSDCHPTAGLDSNYLSQSEPDEYRQNSGVPSIVPCYNGKSLKIHNELVCNGLCAISIKHHNGNCVDERLEAEDRQKATRNISDDDAEHDVNLQGYRDKCRRDRTKTSVDMPECLKVRMKRRNSFWNIHRPELSKLTWPENFVSSAVLQDFFHNHLRIHGTFCEPLHEFTNRSSLVEEEFRDYCKLRSVPITQRHAVLMAETEIVPPRVLPPDEKIVSIMEKSRSVELNDEDLAPEAQVHKSRAEFCVTIGEYVRRPPIKRTTSQVVPKSSVQPANRFESLTLKHEGLLSKEVMVSEERVSSIIGSTEFRSNSSSEKNSKKLSSGIVLRCASFVDSQRLVVTSPPSLNDLETSLGTERTEDSGDPARLRTILSPREEGTQEPTNGQNKV
ncbi:hypothetical protein RUM44_009565 [Polyplax serrata]|uniref:Uncharacterized protein n=1 Tax=Polyplax serrata TaxID=468196 RepID=A0ABR1AT14_POLSC